MSGRCLAFYQITDQSRVMSPSKSKISILVVIFACLLLTLDAGLALYACLLWPQKKVGPVKQSNQ